MNGTRATFRAFHGWNKGTKTLPVGSKEKERSDRTGPEVTAKVRANRKRMGRAFYDRSPEVVARQLIGKVLRHNYKGEWLSGRIVEVEAYLGLNDAASHTFIGQTERNRVLFGPPGVAYVYLVYGMYYCLNVSCLPAGEPGGVLFRAIEPLEGVKTMARLKVYPKRRAPLESAGAQVNCAWRWESPVSFTTEWTSPGEGST